MYKPKTIHYLFSYEYLADRYIGERPYGMCPDEWDIKILECSPAKYFEVVDTQDNSYADYEYGKLLDWYGDNMHKAEYINRN
tara:strand:+ start:958 stop:1203 length:246 start_codon:yes stop_codon:yes gene_type:complete